MPCRATVLRLFQIQCAPVENSFSTQLSHVSDLRFLLLVVVLIMAHRIMAHMCGPWKADKKTVLVMGETMSQKNNPKSSQDVKDCNLAPSKMKSYFTGTEKVLRRLRLCYLMSSQ